MHHAVVPADRRQHAGLLQSLAVGFPFVSERVVLGGDHQRGRQAAHVRRLEGRRVRVVPILGAGEVRLPHPHHRVAREELPLRIVAVGGGVEVRIDDRVHQELKCDWRTVAVPRHERHGGREVAAGAVAPDGQPAPVGVEALGVLGNPPCGGVAVLGGSREAMRRRQSIVDGHHHASAAVAEHARQRIVRNNAAHDPAAAVEERQDRKRTAALRRVDADRHLALGAGNGAVLDGGHGLGLPLPREEHLVDDRRVHRGRCRRCVGIGRRRRPHLVEERLQLRINGHGILRSVSGGMASVAGVGEGGRLAPHAPVAQGPRRRLHYAPRREQSRRPPPPPRHIDASQRERHEVWDLLRAVGPAAVLARD